MLKTILRWVLRALYGFRAFNESVLLTEGPVLLLPNHLSWWDWLFIGVCLEDDWRFVTSRSTADLSWLHRRIMVNRRTFPVDMNSPFAVKHMAAYLLRGGRLVLFPEGRMSTTGSRMKLFEGTGFLIAKTKAKLITGFIRGAGRLPWSPNPNRKAWFPQVSVHFSTVLTSPKADHTTASETRTAVTDWLQDQMAKQEFECEMALGPATVPAAIFRTAISMRRRVILQDATLGKLTYGRLLAGATALAARWRTRLIPSPGRVGVLLPNVNGFPVVLLSLWMQNRIPAILNYTMGPASLPGCARLAELKQVITSRSFIERLKLDLNPLQASGIELVFIEDVRASISWWDRLKAMARSRLRPEAAETAPPDDPALILFTSGSEGDPKGVELSHRNILANIRQMLAVVDLQDTDRFFNALPLFHCFGVTAGLILPLVKGAFVFLYLSPLHYRVVPAALYNLDCTILFGTNTFLAGYAKKAHPYDFRSARYVFAGAEKLQEQTRVLWMRKFGIRILEGYGATECSPCVSLSVPMHSRVGSAGRFLPGIDYKLERVEGIDERGTLDLPDRPSATDGFALRTAHSAPPAAGRLFVRGPNIMRGYLNPAANAQFQSLSGWYDTGDIVEVDAGGFVFIQGRLKRFAKVSGEMVSLTAVEDALASSFPQYGPRFAIAVVARPDETRGEELIAVTNEPRLKLGDLRAAIQARGLGNLGVPRGIKVFHDLPYLGTGKINHRELERILGSTEHD